MKTRIPHFLSLSHQKNTYSNFFCNFLLTFMPWSYFYNIWEKIGYWKIYIEMGILVILVLCTIFCNGCETMWTTSRCSSSFFILWCPMLYERVITWIVCELYANIDSKIYNPGHWVIKFLLEMKSLVSRLRGSIIF